MAIESSSDPFAEAYRAYLKAVQQAWAEVDVDEMVAARNDVKHLGYSSAGSWSSIGTLGTGGSIGGTAGTIGTLGSIFLKPEEG